MFSRLYSSSFDLQWLRYEQLQVMLKRNGVEIERARCLELGPGNSSLVAKALVADGAKEVIQIDRFSRRTNATDYLAYDSKESEYLRTRLENHSASGASSSAAEAGDSIVFELADIATYDLTGLAHFAYSISVLEHVVDVPATVAGMRRNIAKGGMTWHHIDMRDHYNFETPFLFYKYSDKTWKRWLSRPGVSFTNRLRIDDFRRIFEENGFRIREEVLEKRPLPTDERLAPGFADKPREVLEVAQADVLLEAV